MQYKERTILPMMSGATTNSMKPICILHKLIVSRSHIGEISSPIDFSLSPCKQNSSTTKSAHFAHNAYGLNGFEISEQCNTSSIKKSLFFSSLRQSISSFAPEQKLFVSSPFTSKNNYQRRNNYIIIQIVVLKRTKHKLT